MDWTVCWLAGWKSGYLSLAFEATISFMIWDGLLIENRNMRELSYCTGYAVSDHNVSNSIHLASFQPKFYHFLLNFGLNWSLITENMVDFVRYKFQKGQLMRTLRWNFSLFYESTYVNNEMFAIQCQWTTISKKKKIMQICRIIFLVWDN